MRFPYPMLLSHYHGCSVYLNVPPLFTFVSRLRIHPFRFCQVWNSTLQVAGCTVYHHSNYAHFWNKKVTYLCCMLWKLSFLVNILFFGFANKDIWGLVTGVKNTCWLSKSDWKTIPLMLLECYSFILNFIFDLVLRGGRGGKMGWAHWADLFLWWVHWLSSVFFFFLHFEMATLL